MKIQNPEPIDEKDLEKFIASKSDFAFEMRVLSVLNNLNFRCSHAATYQDPVTQKVREYDIRACKSDGKRLLYLAVECKNVSAGYPLLISAVPRSPREAFHDLIVYLSQRTYAKFDVARVEGHESIYKPRDIVGKRMNQILRSTQGEISSNDSPTFDKFSQAISSTKDVVAEALSDENPCGVRAVVPVLVTSENNLWQVDYDEWGAITTMPRRVEEVSYLIDHTWTNLTDSKDSPFHISHLHIVTLSGLERAVTRWMGPQGFFPTD
jgi:hypothetical protein